MKDLQQLYYDSWRENILFLCAFPGFSWELFIIGSWEHQNIILQCCWLIKLPSLQDQQLKNDWSTRCWESFDINLHRGPRLLSNQIRRRARCCHTCTLYSFCWQNFISFERKIPHKMFCWQNDCEYFPLEVVVVLGRTLIIWLPQSSVCVYKMSAVWSGSEN